MGVYLAIRGELRLFRQEYIRYFKLYFLYKLAENINLPDEKVVLLKPSNH
ncbi:MAG: hypothetical protein F6K54_36200 [Okeania sp. SIO3B5]|nr:hypothetical protein [Okeania sp. SIO3B5]NEO58025.1 hypothetical protein [Okeania sp. SIO3B5]